MVYSVKIMKNTSEGLGWIFGDKFLKNRRSKNCLETPINKLITELHPCGHINYTREPYCLNFSRDSKVVGWDTKKDFENKMFKNNMELSKLSREGRGVLGFWRTNSFLINSSIC